MPEPVKEIDVASDMGDLPADGNVYTVLEFDDKTIKELKEYGFWRDIDNLPKYLSL